MSLVESVSNIGAGFFLALVTQIIVYPMFGLSVPLHSQFWIALIFTGVSMVRHYVFRRVFEFIRVRTR